MEKNRRILLVLFALPAIGFALGDHRDPARYPSKGDQAWCDTTGGAVVKHYEDIYRGDSNYSIAPTPKDPDAPVGQDVYYSPTIDGLLEDSLWKFAETLLINTWTDGGMTDACSDNPHHYGPRDLHAIWRFMYNREGLFIGVETFDDIHDVDSLSGWYLQDGIEIGIDPYDWGYYGNGSGNWNTNTGTGGIFKRYFSNANQLIPCGGAAPCQDESALSYLHILKRMNEEPYIAGLVHGTHLHNYGRGDEATNFRMGDNNLYGMQYAIKYQGVDEYFREVHHVEFKFPFHTDLWKSLDVSGTYYDATGLPKAGTLLKMDFFSNDDDILGPNGSNPNYTQVGRRRDVPFAQEASGHDHWSDTKYYQTFKYVGTNRPVASPFVGNKNHGDPRLAGVWVDAATETQHYDFTGGGAVDLWGTFYFYDSLSALGGEVKGATKAADYTLKRPSSSKYQDTLIITPTISQPALKLLRFLPLGYDQLEGRWVESKLKVAAACGKDSSWEPISDQAREFRFIPYTRLDKDTSGKGILANSPAYKGKEADSLRIYNFKTQQLIASYAYTAREAVSGRSQVHFSYDFDKLAAYENDPNFPKHLVVTENGQQKFFASYGRFNTVSFGESGLNKNTRIFLARTAPKNVFPYNFIVWDKYQQQVFYVPDTTQTARQFVTFYPDMILGTDSSKGKFWDKIADVSFNLDTAWLAGYSDSTDADSLHFKAAGEVWGDSLWIRQQLSFIVNHQDTFKFWDTTQTQKSDEFTPNYVALCDLAVEEATAIPLQNLEIGSYPNPFNPSATVLYSIPPRMAGEYFSVKVFNIRGQLVRTLAKGKVGMRGVTRHRVVWPGIDNLGRPMGSGMYYYKLIVGNQVKRGTMVMVK